MKQLTQLAKEESESRGNDVLWLAEIVCPDGPRYYATRPLQRNGRTYQPKIVAISGGRLNLAQDLLDSVAAPDRLTLTLANYPEESDERFELLMDRFQLEGLECAISVFLRDEGGAAGLADIIPIQTYVIEDVELSARAVTLRLIDLLASRGARRIGRIIDEEFATGVSSRARGEMAPVVFGRVTECPLVPFRFGATTRLAAELTPHDSFARVDSLDGFPASGKLQIEGELLSYVAVNDMERTLGTPESLLVRPDPRLHRNNTPVYHVPDGGFEFLVADHPCTSISEVKADGAPVTEGSYEPAQEVIKGKAVQKLVFPELPHKDEFAATAQQMIINGASHESSWVVGAHNTAREPQKACDPNELTTFAEVTKVTPLLEIEFRGDLSDGESRYGKLESVRLGLRYFASRFWEPENQIVVSVAKGAQRVEAPLARPDFKHTTGYAESHTHGHSLSFDVQDSRPLFAVNTDRAVVAFDEVEGETDLGGGNYYWKDAERAKDGDFATGVENFSGPGVTQCSLPLTLRVRRQPREDMAARLTQIALCVEMESLAGAQMDVELRIYIPGKFNHVTTMHVDATRRTYCSALLVSDAGFASLAHPESRFDIRVPDGGKLRVYEAWLELRYQQIIAGQSIPLAQRKSGAIGSAPELAVRLPSHVFYQTLDLAALIQGCGGWAFFSSTDGCPTVRVQFGSASDPVAVYVADICWEVAFRRVERMSVAEEITATVEGIAAEGALLENPADIIRHVLRSPDFLGLSENHIDGASFDSARERLEELGYRFAARLSEPERLRDVLLRAALEARSRLVVEGGKVKLLVSPRRLLKASAVFNFTSDVVVNANPKREFAPASSVVNKINVFFQRDYTKASGSAAQRYRSMISVCDEASAAQSWGLREANLYTRWHANSAAAAIYDLAGFLLQRHAQKELRSQLETPLLGLALERGDVVTVSHAQSRLEEATAEIIGAGMAALNRLAFRLRLAPRARICWQQSTATRIEHLPGNVEKEFFIEDGLVAALDFLGNLELAGGVREGALEEFGMAAPIVYEAAGGRLIFGVQSGGTGYASAFAITRDGDLHTRGEVHEQTRNESIEMNACWESDEEYFALSLNSKDAMFAYISALRVIQLVGRVREHTDFKT